MTTVLLTDNEVHLARAVGKARRASAIASGRPARYGCASADLLDADMQSAGGELAAAIAYHLPWTGCYFRDLSGGKPSDIGTATEVRTRSRDWYDLIVHPEDEDGWAFVLVTGTMPAYNVVGHIRGDVAKRQEWWKDPAGGRPAFFVPQAALSPAPQL